MSSTTPTHLGFILDGNRRWAKAQGLPVLEGHRKGYERLKDIAQACFDRNIRYMSAYVFSTENWSRSKEEVGYLMNMALTVLLKDAKELHRKNVRLKILGLRSNLSEKLLKAIEKAEQLTAGNTAGTLAICFNYGGQQELVEATKAIVASGTIPADITEETIKNHLYTKDMPAPDMIIRTSGEQRLSNFLLWDSAYSELMFVEQNWPDFDEKLLEEVLREYASRARRFGS